MRAVVVVKELPQRRLAGVMIGRCGVGGAGAADGGSSGSGGGSGGVGGCCLLRSVLADGRGEAASKQCDGQTDPKGRSERCEGTVVGERMPAMRCGKSEQ